MNKKLTILSFIGIIVIAAVLRLWQLGHVPGSIDWDEASLGYNAYSLLLTGKDEYGKAFPLVLQSFNDYKPALYSYLIIPFIPLFGLTSVAVRLPSVLFGVLMVIASYFLVKELFNGKKAEILSLLVALLLAISPWHIQFSRVAFEANVGLSLNIFGALFFLKGLKKSWFLPFSALSFALSLYAYQSEKVFVPLFVLVLVGVFFKQVTKLSKTYLFVAIIIGVVAALPITLFTFTNKDALTRAKGVSIFADKTEDIVRSIDRVFQDDKRGDVSGKLFDNRRVVYAKTITINYLSYYDLNWLFIRGDYVGRHQPPNMGHLYLWELPFLLIGIFILIFGNFDKKTKVFIIFWFLITPIPASVTWDGPNAVRTINFLPTFQIFIALGILMTFSYLRKKRHRISYPLFAAIALTITVNGMYYLDQYFVQYNYYTTVEWQYGYQQAVEKIEPLSHKYTKVVVSNEAPLDQSYIFFLFYLRYPPARYQLAQNRSTDEYKSRYNFGNYEFRHVDLPIEEKNSKILYIVAGREGKSIVFPEGFKIIDTIYYPNGNPGISLVEG